MITKNDPKEDFKNWLFHEDLTVKEADLDGEDFHLVVENIGNAGFSFEVGKPKNKPFFRLITNARFSPETTKQIKDLGVTANKFLIGLQRELLKF